MHGSSSNSPLLYFVVAAVDKKVTLFEGDIELIEQPEDLNTPEALVTDKNVMKRSLRRSQEYLWIDRVIPYEFTASVGMFYNTP